MSNKHETAARTEKAARFANWFYMKKFPACDIALLNLNDWKVKPELVALAKTLKTARPHSQETLDAIVSAMVKLEAQAKRLEEIKNEMRFK